MLLLLVSCLLFEPAGIDFSGKVCCDDTGTDQALDLDGDGVTIADGDCNDQDPDVNPYAPELCDSVDNNCDGLIDQSFTVELGLEERYFDSDQDGYGQDTVFYVCLDTNRWSDKNTDCNDGDSTINPSADELCDGVDNNCSGLIDDADPLVRSPLKYQDLDGDGYGNELEPIYTCEIDGVVLMAGDCNDQNPLVNPGEIEISMDLIDQDCDGLDVQDYSECGSQVEECSEVITLNALLIPLQRVEVGVDPLGRYEILYPFAMMSTEMTQVVYESLGFSNPSVFQDNNSGQNPVDLVTWHEAAMAANVLTTYVNLNYNVSFSECYDCDAVFCEASPEELECTGYRLPTNAEWEYASRAGTLSDFSTDGSNGGDTVVKSDTCDFTDGQFTNISRLSLTDFAWYCANAYSSDDPYNLSTYPVAEKAPNPWGFYDMHGNVSEWVYDTDVGFGFGGSDYWSYTPDSEFGLVRGGAFYDQPDQLSNFYISSQIERYYSQTYSGFRLVRRLEY